MPDYIEEMRFQSLCMALSMTEKGENWSIEQIEDEAHRIMDLEDEEN